MSPAEIKPRPLCVVLFQGNTMCFPIAEADVDKTDATLAQAMASKTVVAFKSHAWERWVVRGDLIIGWYFVPEDTSHRRIAQSLEKVSEAVNRESKRGEEWREES